MTIGKEIISEIKKINDEKLNGYVYVSYDYCEDEEDIVKYVIDELFVEEYIKKTLTIKDIETYSFTVEMSCDDNYEYTVDLYDYNHLNLDDFYFHIERSIKTV